jgi:predicted  nucleic acid-binding Zn-ribbon protein
LYIALAVPPAAEDDMSQTKALFRLQKTDTGLDTCRRRVREITEILEQDAVLREAQEAMDSLQADLRPQEARHTDLSLEIQTVDTQTKQFSDRLYGGTVSNPKELEDLQNKIAERKRRREQLENHLLETMIVVEDLQEQLQAATDHLTQVKLDRAEQHQDLTQELRQLKAEIAQLKAERQVVLGEIAPENREIYKALRAQKRGQAVATLSGDSCAVCGVQQTTTIAQQVRQGQDVILCASCGRILVAD